MSLQLPTKYSLQNISTLENPLTHGATLADVTSVVDPDPYSDPNCTKIPDPNSMYLYLIPQHWFYKALPHLLLKAAAPDLCPPAVRCIKLSLTFSWRLLLLTSVLQLGGI